MSVRFLVGGNSAVVPAGIVVTDNAFYNSTVQLGYNETIADDVTIHDNYIAAARLQVGPHQTVDIQGNTVAATADVVILKGDIPAGTWDLNTYYSDNTGTPHYPFSREASAITRSHNGRRRRDSMPQPAIQRAYRQRT